MRLGAKQCATPCAMIWMIVVFICTLVAAPAFAQDALSGASYATARHRRIRPTRSRTPTDPPTEIPK